MAAVWLEQRLVRRSLRSSVIDIYETNGERTSAQYLHYTHMEPLLTPTSQQASWRSGSCGNKDLTNHSADGAFSNEIMTSFFLKINKY